MASHSLSWCEQSPCNCCTCLQEQNCQSPLQHLQLLIAALRHESVAVRHVGLGEVRSFLLQYKTFMGDAMAGLLSCSGPAALPGMHRALRCGSGSCLAACQCLAGLELNAAMRVHYLYFGSAASAMHSHKFVNLLLDISLASMCCCR